MDYITYDALKDQPNIIVDGSGNPSTVLVLSHWPHSGTPSEFKADTSTEIVLNFLQSNRRSEFEATAQTVSNNHFDEDGLMSVDEGFSKAVQNLQQVLIKEPLGEMWWV